MTETMPGKGRARSRGLHCLAFSPREPAPLFLPAALPFVVLARLIGDRLDGREKEEVDTRSSDPTNDTRTPIDTAT